MSEFDDIFREVAAGERQREAAQAQAANVTEKARQEFATERARTLRLAQYAASLMLAKPVKVESFGYFKWVKKKGFLEKGFEPVYQKVLEGWTVTWNHQVKDIDGDERLVADNGLVVQPNGVLVGVNKIPNDTLGVTPFTQDSPGPLNTFGPPNSAPYVYNTFKEKDIQTGIGKLLMDNGIVKVG